MPELKHQSLTSETRKKIFLLKLVTLKRIPQPGSALKRHKTLAKQGKTLLNFWMHLNWLSTVMICHVFSLSFYATRLLAVYMNKKIDLPLEDIFAIYLRFSDTLALLVSSIAVLNWQISQVKQAHSCIALACSDPGPCTAFL